MVSAVPDRGAPLMSDKAVGRDQRRHNTRARKARPEASGAQEYKEQFHVPEQYPYRQNRDLRRRTKLIFQEEPKVSELLAQDDGWLRRQSMESLARLNPAQAEERQRREAASRQLVAKRREFARWKEQRELPKLDDDKRRSLQRWVLPQL